MKLKVYFIIFGWLLFVGSCLPLAAQEKAAFDPTTPAEPNALYRVKVEADPPQAVSYLRGAGDYVVGSNVSIGASSYSSAYVLTHWTKNGEVYDEAGTKTQFTYTVTGDDVTFTAHYTYSPTLPDEPQGTIKWRLYMVAEPLGGGYFNRSSGEKYENGTAVDVTAYCNTGYDFLGWYNGSTLVSTNPSISYEIQNSHTTLTAKFEYNPTLPAEPGWTEDNQQGDVDTSVGITGDADGNGELTVTDVVVIMNAILANEYAKKGDVDGNGELTVNDVVAVVNLILGTNK